MSAVTPTPTPTSNCTCAPPSSRSDIPGWLLETFGYAGGALLAFALVPQIYRTFRLRSARDMSYVWQTIYCLGLACTLIYLIFKKALAAWVFIVVELALGVIFICVKIYFEQVAPKGKNTSFALVSSCFGGVSFEQPRKSIVELLSTVKEVLHSMSFMETHQSIEVVGDTENEPASLRCIVHAYIYMNEFMVELRYSKETAQLLIQVTAHRHLENLSELANRIDQQITLSLPGSSMLHHGAT